MAEASTAAAGSAHGRAPRLWTQAWMDALPIAPVWVGCAFAAGHVLLGALYFAVFVAARMDGTWPAYRELLPAASVYGLLIGYATAALAYARRGHEATLRDLRPALECTEAELSALRRELRRPRMAALRGWGVVAAVTAMVLTYFTTEVGQRFGRGHPALPWILWQNALCFWLLSRTIAYDLGVSRVFSRAARRHAAIELFDLTPLAPLARRGLQSALLIVLAISIFSLIFGLGDVSPVVPALQAATVLLAAFALVLPSLGIRHRVRAAKREELARLGAELRDLRARRPVTGGPERQENEARLATLLALRQHVEATREWPFDLGTLGRFLLYAVIGVGSWFGGAAVERLLDLLLG